MRLADVEACVFIEVITEPFEDRSGHNVQKNCDAQCQVDKWVDRLDERNVFCSEMLHKQDAEIRSSSESATLN